MTKPAWEPREQKRYAWEKSNAFFTDIPDMIITKNSGIDPDLSTEAYAMTMESSIQNTNELEIAACCPTTGKWVIGQISSRYNDLGLEATWWECPSCQGCHVSFDVATNHLEEVMLS